MRAWIALTFLIAACGPKDAFRGLEYRGHPPKIGLAPTVLLQDLPGASEGDLLNDGVYIGNIVFSGGFETVPGDGGLQNRSVGVFLEMQDIYRRQAVELTEDWFTTTLTGHKVDWIPLGPLPEGAVVTPGRRDFRGSYDELGHDNQPLPLFELDPQSLSAPPAVPDGVGLVLVPYVVHYYSHNNGWFLGQTWGTDAGARLRVLWSLHDASTGGIVAWGDHEATATVHGLSSATSAQLQDLMIEVEAQIARSLDKRLP